MISREHQDGGRPQKNFISPKFKTMGIPRNRQMD